jgi:ribosomal protein S18 acetylase RimI-like enzyme
MEKDLAGFVNRDPASIAVEHFRAGDSAMLATIQNRIFAGSWGFCPNSPEEIRYFFRLTQSKWQDILMIRENAKIIGYSWLHHVFKEGKDQEKRRWRLHMFGTDPEFQGKGWGKKLLQASLEHLWKRDATSLELTVDSENTPAIQLYKSAGFRVKYRDFWYEKDLL